MEAIRQIEKKRRSHFAGRGFHIMALAVGAAICLSLSVISRYPAPEDPMFAGRLAEEGLHLDDQEHVFAIMEQDVSAVELIIHDYNEEENREETYNIYISSGTVADALEKAGVILGEFDEISIDDNAQIHNGMEINITRVRVEQEYEYESIPYETVRQASELLLVNVERVVQDGVDGSRCYTYDIIYKNGVATERVLVGTNVVKKPINQIISYGTAAYYRPDPEFVLNEEDQTITLGDGIVLHYSGTVNVNATAYTTEGQYNKITKSGAIARYGIIAVDPKVIPLGTEMFIVAADGTWVYGYALAGDTGGFIKGNRIDLFYDTRDECITFGRQDAIVYILTNEE